MKNIFESVQFINESNDIDIEINVIDESSEILNEGIMLKFKKKDEIPKEFKKEVSEILETIEDACGKKGVEGIFKSTLLSMLRLRVGNARKKISEGKIKNCYILSFMYKDIQKAAGAQPSKNKFFYHLSKDLVDSYIESVLIERGYKKTSSVVGAYKSWYKQGDDCIYGVDAALMEDESIQIYIRCLEDTESNKEILSGGKEFYKE